MTTCCPTAGEDTGGGRARGLEVLYVGTIWSSDNKLYAKYPGTITTITDHQCGTYNSERFLWSTPIFFVNPELGLKPSPVYTIFS